MAMTLDSRQHSHFPGMNYDAMRYQPSFTDPWATAPSSNHNQLYAAPMQQNNESHRYTQAPSVSSAYTGHISAPTESLTRPFGNAYSTANTTSTYAPTSAPQQSYVSAYSYGNDRAPTHPSVASNILMGSPTRPRAIGQSSRVDSNSRLHNASEADRQSFSDALDASRGMVAMSQSDVTPRNIYGNNADNRSSTDSYGFPSHSSRSSISSASTYPTYYNSSASEASVGDYSSASESIDMSNHRTLPRPNGLLGNLPPAPQSMMGQFSSKVSSSSQKKHKCKICDKRFTRPSSLQTHMYSHTGEKPYACEVEGCGRHFSVVSNLRRHRKVHKGEAVDHSSPEDDE